MTIDSDYSITRLFATKHIHILIKDENKKSQRLTLVLHSVRDFMVDDHWNITYSVLTNSKFKETIIQNPNFSDLSFLKMLLYDLGAYDKFRETYTILCEQLPILFPGFALDPVNHEFIIDGVTITDEIWEYIIYVIKLSYGEKVEKPPSFSSEEARKFYLAQKALEAKIAHIRAKDPKNTSNEEALAKTMLSIVYSFPSLTIDYLYDQTMAQIQWLAKYAAKSVSYEVNAQAFAAGNTKKGKKLDFFIK